MTSTSANERQLEKEARREALLRRACLVKFTHAKIVASRDLDLVLDACAHTTVA